MKTMWLFDVFNDDISTAGRMLTTLKSLGLKTNDPVYATYVANPGEQKIADEPDQGLSLAKKHLSQVLAKKKNDLNIKPFVVKERSASFTQLTDRVLQEAQKNDVSLVTLQTHGKKGFKDLILGSFAETFIHRSKISMLVLSPVSKPAKNLSKILYATDLTSGALESVLQAVRIARQANAKLCLFHIAQPNYDSDLDDPESEGSKYHKSVERKLSLLVTAARKEGVETEAYVDSDWKSAAELILRAAKKKQIDLIITHAKKGPIENLFLGSTSSQLIRSSHIPLYILRS